MSVLSKTFGRSKSAVAPVAEPTEPIAFSGPVELSVQQGMVAHFFRKDKKSWPGVLWAVHCAGDNRQHTFLVQTYFSSNPPDQREKQALADKAKDYIAARLRAGPIAPDEQHELD